MKKIISLMVVAFAFVMISNAVYAQDTQNQYLNQNKIQKMQGVNWVDADGDGICDNVGTQNQTSKQYKKMYKGSNAGMGTGTGNGYGFGDGSALRPQDGTGFGRKAGAGDGTGTCDGTGTGRKGSGRRGGNK